MQLRVTRCFDIEIRAKVKEKVLKYAIPEIKMLHKLSESEVQATAQ